MRALGAPSRLQAVIIGENASEADIVDE
jgi:hypothetical protein